MPTSFWQTQYEEMPKGWKSTFVKAKNGKPGYWTTFNHWGNCCNTVKRMVGYNATRRDRVQILHEHGSVKAHTESLDRQRQAQAGRSPRSLPPPVATDKAKLNQVARSR